MKRTIRKTLAVLLAAAMLCAAGVAAEAEEAQPAEEDSGILDAARLDAWAESFAQEKGIDPRYQNLSIGFCYTGTGDCWYYNPDIWMYSASMYKVPVSMLLAEKVASGELTQESIVNGTTVEYVESTALVYSNNDSGHSIVSYLGGTYAGKCSDMTEKYTDLPADYFSSDFLDVSYYTARYMTQVMKTLYEGGEEQFPHVIEYLLQAQPGAYFRKSEKLEGVYEVAQKFGAYEEPNGNNNNHCAAIIYTPTPIIAVVMTRNIMDYQNIIAQIGAYLADYSLELDVKAEELAREEAERAAAEAAAAAAAADDVTVEMPMPETESAEIEQTGSDIAADTGNGTVLSAVGDPAETESAANESTEKKIPTAAVILAAVLVAAVIVGIVLLLLLRKRSAQEEDWEEVSDPSDPGLGEEDTEPAQETLRQARKPERIERREKKEKPAGSRNGKTGSGGGYVPRH